MGKKGLSPESQALFPLQRIDSVVELFKREITEKEPNLAVLSIILGALEHGLVDSTKNLAATNGQQPPAPQTLFQMKKDLNSTDKQGPDNSNSVSLERPDFPAIELDIVMGLYEKFEAILFTSLGRLLFEYKKNEENSEKVGTTVDLVKNLSDTVWNSLSKSYNADKPHLQTLYTYLTANRLDRFGVAFAVVAGAQMLDLDDIHLALSEDHAWVIFGPNGESNLEVTWHGKGLEDKRGIPAGSGEDEHSWLYLLGSPVICNRHMELVSLVAAMNSTIHPNVESKELSLLQQKLLWILYDAGHLAKYPMAIGNLADLEDTAKTPSRPSCQSLYEEGIAAAKKHYNSRHVYPHISYAGYFNRHQEFKLALKHWANAADVMRMYKYTKNDEDIYTQFLEIIKDHLKNLIKQASSGISAMSILRDPNCFATLLRFLDGLCQWEENSEHQKLIIHIGWAKPWLFAVGKFEYSIRREVRIICRRRSDNAEGDEDVSSSSKKLMEQIDVDVNGNREISTTNVTDSFYEPQEITVELTSHKMCDIKDLVLRERLNTAAITLVLTAQSIKPTESHPTKVTKAGELVVGSRKRTERKSIAQEATNNGPSKDAATSGDGKPVVRPPARKRGRIS